MDEARLVLDRLDRIEALHRDNAPPLLVLAELQELLGEAEAWARAEGARVDGAQQAVGRVREALAWEPRCFDSREPLPVGAPASRRT